MKIENWTILGIIGMIVLAVFIVFFVFRRTQVTVQDFTSKPSILFTDSSYEIVPVEKYRIEYDTGDQLYTDAELTDYLNWNINWETKGGFDPVKRLRITRTVGGSTVQSVILSRTSPGDADFFRNFRNSSYTFVGEDFATPGTKSTDVGIGQNVFSMDYSVTESGDDFLPIPALNVLVKDINKNDVLIPLEAGKFINVPFQPTLKSPNVEEGFLNKGYFFYPNDSKEISLNSSLMGKIDIKLEIVLSSTGDSINLKRESTDNFLIKNADGSIGFGDGTTDSPLNLNIITDGEPDYLILGTIKTVGTVERVNEVIAYNEGRFILTDLESIDTEDVYASIKLYFYESEKINVPCDLGDPVEIPCQDKPRTVDGIELKRGEKAVKVKINKRAVGAGTCTHPLFGDSTISDLRETSDGFRYKTEECPRNCLYEQKSDDVINRACSTLGANLPGRCYMTDNERKLNSLGDAYEIFPLINGGTCPPSNVPAAFDCDKISKCGDCGHDSSKVCDTSTTLNAVRKSTTSYSKKTGDRCFTPTTVPANFTTNPDTTCPPSCIAPSWEISPQTCSAVGRRDRIVTNLSSATAERSLCANPAQPPTTVDDISCVACPYDTDKGTCGLSSTGKGQRSYTYTYNTTGTNTGCVQTGAPSPAVQLDSDCPNVACPWTTTKGDCVPGVALRRWSFPYNTTGDNEGCSETGAPSSYLQRDESCAPTPPPPSAGRWG
jgi:hypothetical protein